jgi:APA family basic amino acid/polyamine antiporter
VKTYPPQVALAIVVANMVGTGVFTSLGFQLLSLSSPLTILALWVVGGLCALCGALCYAELGTRHTASGGEYHFLTVLVHPYAGFISGLISATVGFAAPVALAALTFGSYLSAGGVPLDPRFTATGLIGLLVLLHTRTRRNSAAGQVWLTVFKLALIILFIGLALVNTLPYSDQLLANNMAQLEEILRSETAIALIYVTYAYSGWNAATYILGEMDNAQRHLPWVLGGGCALVALLYVALNGVFLAAAPVDELRGEVEIAYIVADHILGGSGAVVVSLILAGVLISTVSAMILAGPRALQRLGEDYPRLALLGRRNTDGLPTPAILSLGGLALVFLWSATFEQILLIAGFLMALNTLVTVAALFISRRLDRGVTVHGGFTMPLYPWPALVFLAITGWTVLYSALAFPSQLIAGMVALVLGIPLYRWARG